jgi:hypothetical protein
LRSVPVGKFILMAVFVGMGYAVGMVAYLGKIHAPVAFAPVMRQLVAGVKVGALMGFGMELVDLVGARIRVSDQTYAGPGT